MLAERNSLRCGFPDMFSIVDEMLWLHFDRAELPVAQPKYIVPFTDIVSTQTSPCVGQKRDIINNPMKFIQHLSIGFVFGLGDRLLWRELW